MPRGSRSPQHYGIALEGQLLVSVVTPVRNRKALLRELVDSLWAQSLDPTRFEIVVVDDCSSDGTSELLAELAQRSPCRFVHQRLATHGGAVRARNEGVRLAQAPLLAFTDSDCRVTPRWLELGVGAFGSDAGVGFATGPILNKPEQTVTFFSVGGNPLPGENPVYPLANAFYRKQVILEVGGFDESAWLREVNTTAMEFSDVDMAYRVLGRGYRNAFVPDLVVYHHVFQVSPVQWLLWTLKVAQLPEVLRRYPVLRKTLLWKGPLLSPDHLLFYLALLGGLLTLYASPWFGLLALPHVYRTAFVAGRGLSLRALVAAPARVALLTVRQALISSFLLWGSLRARNVVL